MTKVEQILKIFQVSYQQGELTQVFTHHSFREDKNNSRYVLLGKYFFKGLLSQYIFKHISGTGMQLERYLSNIFSEKALTTLFNQWDLKREIRIAPEQKDKIPKSIFVYAFLGYLSQKMNETETERFVKQYFIFPNDRFLPGNSVERNHKEQLFYLCSLHYDQKPVIRYYAEDNLQITEVILNEEVIGSHASPSQKYATKKATRLALKNIVSRLETNLLSDPVFQENEKRRVLQEEKQELLEKEQRQKQHRKRIQAHSERMTEKRERENREALERDRKRRDAKQKAKQKQKTRKSSVYREYTIEEIRAMSPSKRRNLQDRGIIPQGVY